MSTPTPLTPEEEAKLTSPTDPEGSFHSTGAADLVVGDTGTGKTTLIGTMALDIFRATGKITRYYIFDTGGFGAFMASLIADGIVEVWRVRTRDPDGRRAMSVGTCHLAALGCWPVSRDPRTGVSAEGVALVAPTTTVIRGVDASGVIRGEWRSEDMIPGDAKQSLKFTRLRKTTPGFENVGGMAFDGLSSMSAYSLEELNHKAARGELGGIKGNINTVTSGGLDFGVAGMGGIGFVQTRAMNWASAMSTIPNLVRPPLVTALKQRGEEQNMPIYGPKIEGKAQIGVIPSWFGNCLGMEAVPGRNAQGAPKVEYRLYLQPYSLEDNAVNKCKNRANDPSLPMYIADPEGATLENGLLYSGWGMHKVYQLLDAAVAKCAANSAKLLGGRKAPGLGSGEMPEAANQAAVGMSSQTVGKGRPAPPPPPKKVGQAPAKAAAPAPKTVADLLKPEVRAEVTAALQLEPEVIAAAPAPPPVLSSPRPAGQGPVGALPVSKAPTTIPARRTGPPPMPSKR